MDLVCRPRPWYKGLVAIPWQGWGSWESVSSDSAAGLQRWMETEQLLLLLAAATTSSVECEAHRPLVQQ